MTLGSTSVNAPGPWEHRMVAANGARFHVVEAGTGPLVLLLHGFPTFWWTWRHLLPVLADAGYRAVAMDLRGYAGTDKTPRGYDQVTLSGDVASVVRALGERDACLVGHGWGGALAWATAVLHPSLVRGIVPVAAPHPRRLRAAVASDPSQLRAIGFALGYQRPWLPERQLVADGGAAIGRLLRSWSGTPGWPDDDVVATYQATFLLPQVPFSALEYFRWAVRSVGRPDGLRFASRMRVPVGVPVLHLQGERDPVMLPATSAGSEEFVVGPYRRELVDTGHFVHEERPEETGALLLEWLKG